MSGTHVRGWHNRNGIINRVEIIPVVPRGDCLRVHLIRMVGRPLSSTPKSDPQTLVAVAED
jgi:hypothetical protein